MLVLACRPSVRPELPEGLRSAIFIGPEREVEAIERDQGTQAFISPEGGEPLLVGYRSPLDELFLQPGPIGLLVPPTGRPLPLADWYLELERSGEEMSWVESLGVPELAASLRIPSLPADTCALAGGCYPSASARDIGDCRKTCSPVRPMSPVPPEAPLPPVFAACPEEWSSEDGGCRAPATANGCLRGAWQTFAHGACEPFEVCPSGAFRAGADVYVDAQATGVPDGTQLRPYRTLEEAIANGADGRIIAIAPGAYQAQPLSPGTQLIGHCALTTTLLGGFTTRGRVALSSLRLETPPGGPGIEVVDGRLGLASIDAVFSDSEPGILVRAAAGLDLRESQVSSVGPAIRVAGGEVDGSDVVFETQGPSGIEVENGTLRLSRVRARSAGVYAHARRSLLVLDIAVVDAGGSGITAVEGSTATLSQLDLRAGGTGVEVINAKCDVQASRVTAARPHGLRVDRGDLRVSDVVVSDVSGEPTVARGIEAHDSLVEVRRVHVSRVAGSGLSLSGSLLVEDLRAETVDRSQGHLLVVPPGVVSRLQLRRASLVGGAGGLQIEDSAEVTVESLEVQDITGGIAPLRGAIYIGDGPRAELRQVQITDATVYGLWIFGRQRTRQISDLKILGAGTGVRFPTYSTAADPLTLSTTMMSRVDIQGSRGLGFCVGRGWRVQVDNLNIRSTDDSVLADCIGDDRAGIGLVVGGTSEVFLDAFDISDAKVGASLQALAVLDAADGRFADLEDALVAPGKRLSDFLVKVEYRNVTRVGP